MTKRARKPPRISALLAGLLQQAMLPEMFRREIAKAAACRRTPNPAREARAATRRQRRGEKLNREWWGGGWTATHKWMNRGGAK